MLSELTRNLGFGRTSAYSKRVANLVEHGIVDKNLPLERFVGATIAIQGIVEHGNSVTFGGLLGDDGARVTYKDFSQSMSFPLSLVHDAEAAAYAELWRHKDLQSFAYLSLNDHLGSAIIHNGRLLQSDGFGAGVVEHMTIAPSGPRCYCGNHGCFETLLGAKALEYNARMPVEQLFDRLRANDRTVVRLWDDYLTNLAILVHNLRMMTCHDVVIGGRLARYFTEKDLRTLRMKATSMGTFSTYPFHLARGHYGNRATVIGAGIMTINAYLEKCEL